MYEFGYKNTAIINTKTIGKLCLSPTLASSEINIDLSDFTRSKIEIHIFDIVGKKVILPIINNSGNSIKYNSSGLNPGTYQVILNTEQAAYVGKFIKCD